MKHREPSRRRAFVILTTIFFAACLLTVTFITAFKTIAPKIPDVFRTAETEQEEFDDASFERQGKWYGLCAKNSIRSITDFRRTVDADPALKAHYADFRWDSASMGKLDKAMFAYVYFRKDDKIFLKN